MGAMHERLHTVMVQKMILTGMTRRSRWSLSGLNKLQPPLLSLDGGDVSAFSVGDKILRQKHDCLDENT